MSVTRVRFSPDPVLLLGPGPSPVGERVRQALAAPLLGHLDPQFTALMDRVQGDLRTLFTTSNAFTVPISGTGSAGMEACLVNLIAPGERVVVGVHGYFGERIAEIARRAGGEVVEVRADYGTPLDPAAMAAAIAAGDTRVVAFVHAETSTGVRQDPEPIARAARAAGALVVLDCVTSLGGLPVPIDAWGIDAAYSGTQKCLAAPPGLSPVTVSPRALEKVRARKHRPSTWYLDFALLANYWGRDRVYHHTAPIAMVYALAAALDDVFEEGLAARHRRHHEAATALQAGLVALGLELLVSEPHRLPMLTSVCVPDGVDEARVRATLRRDHGIEIGGGLGPLKGKTWRIGLMGEGARLASVQAVLQALAAALRREPRRE